MSVSSSPWDDRYRSAKPDFTPSRFVTSAVSSLSPGTALDLACGTGGSALWLADHGWKVTAVDASSVAIDALNQEAIRRGLSIRTFVADLEKGQFPLDENAWDLIVISKYFQRDLFAPVKQAVAPGGMIVTSALLQTDQIDSPFRVRRGELRGFFYDWKILLDREPETVGTHSLAEVIARRVLK